MQKPKAAIDAEGQNAARVILLCFFASGVSGLVYQVVWLRELVLVFGATTFAVSTVLTAFMGGLALGSFWYGRRAEKIGRPLRVYGYLEIGIGLYGLAVPLIFATLTSVYHSFWQWLHLSFLALSIVRFLFASAVLILPTALMGATLPVLSSYYARDANRIGLKVGLLYSVNTFGAVVGAAATGFLLIPMLGMRTTTGVAAALNILLGVVAIRLANADRAESATSPAAEDDEQDARQSAADLPGERPGVRARARSAASTIGIVVRQALRVHRITALIAFAVSGFVALSYEVIWSRVLALIIGSSVYAFSIMLTTFLIGLAAGASIGARFVDRIRNPMVAFAAIELGVGATCLIGAYLFNDLPYVFVQLYRWVDSTSWGVLLVARFVISSVVMIVPTLLLGSLFPLVVRIVSSGETETDRTGGRSAGEAYASNTLGAIAGSFASGFVLIPWVGLLGSLRLCAALNFVVAAGLFISLRSGADSIPRARRREKHRLGGLMLRRAALSWTGVGISGVLIVATALFEPPWDAEVMSSAVYRYAPQLANKSRQELFDFLKSGQGETIFYEEGITATVAVQRQAGGRVLKVNGKPEASTAGDMPTQILIGTLPLLVRERTDNVLLIGLGSGVTLGSIEQFPVRQITCVELEPAILESTRYFEDVNNRPLEDPRLRMVSNDGRNFIYTTNETFDVIVSEPSNPWISGVANLFTLEYFKRGAERLKEDGLFSQWLQMYEMSPEDVRTLVATFRAAFPHVYIFRGAEGDLMLLGSKSVRRLNLEAINSHFDYPRIAADLKRINTTVATDLLSRFYLGPDEVSALAVGARLNTDDNALIEFNAPRRVGTAEETVQLNVNQLLSYAASPLPYIDGEMNGSGDESGLLIKAALGAMKRDDRARAEQFVGYSLDKKESADANGILGELRVARGDESAAIESWQAALQLEPNHFYSLINLGKLYLTKQDTPRAVGYLDHAIRIDPASARARHLRGLAYQASGDYTRAALEYRKALPDAQYTRSVQTFYLNFGTVLIQIGLYEEASQVLEEYVRGAPNDFDGHYQLGMALEIQAERTLDDEKTRRAVKQLKLALGLNPGHAMAHYHLSKAYRRLDEVDLAEAEFELYERLSP